MAMGDLAVVEAWLEAANARDGAGMEALTWDPVEVVGPRGEGPMPRSVLTEWLGRAGFSAEPLRWFCGGDGRVVVEHAARWDDVATGAAQDRRTIASSFVVRSGQVARYVRHDDGLAVALATAGLAGGDEVRVRGQLVP